MSRDVSTSFGALLRRYRREAGLTQEELAERSGISARAVSDLERVDGRTPRRDTLALLAAALGLTPEQRVRFAAVSRAPAAVREAHNLPNQLTSFIGRTRELAEGEALLAVHRLITLTGVGGTGKTRLGLALAERVRSDYADGAWFVELASLADPGLVPRALADALAVHEQTGETLGEALARALRERQLLLVLDNCEHLVEVCARLAEALLRVCPGLVILATSRQPLDVPGEVTWRIESLGLPDATDEGEVAAVAQTEAVQLFVERAATARPHFALTAQNVAAVAQLCRRLDGIPLALELAAARVRALTPEQLVARVDNRFRLLTAGSRTALPRQQTLQATLDWSYRLLDDDERTLLQRLSVFVGGWTLEAAEAVCDVPPLDGQRIADLMARLVEKSLARLDEAGSAGRYRLLETVRQYAAERLGEAGATETIGHRHAAWALALVERLRPTLLAGAEAATLARFAAEDGNLRQALTWCREHEPEVGLRLCATLWRYWNAGKCWTDGLDWARGFVAQTTDLAAGRAEALLGLSVLAKNQGAFDVSAAAARESRALFRALNDSAGEAAALTNLQIVLVNRLEIADAWRTAQEALTLGRTLGGDLQLGLALTNITPLLGFTGAFERADQALDASLAHLRRAGASESWLIAPHTFRAWLALWRNDLPAARTALAVAERLLKAHPHYLDDDHVPSFLGDLLSWL